MDKVFVMFDEKPCYTLPQLLIRPGMEEKIITKSVGAGNDIDDQSQIENISYEINNDDLTIAM